MKITLRGGIFDGKIITDIPAAALIAETIASPLSLYLGLTDTHPNVAVFRSSQGIGSNWIAAFICIYKKTAEGSNGARFTFERVKMERRCLAANEAGERCGKGCPEGSFFCGTSHPPAVNDFPILNVYAKRPYEIIRSDLAVDVAEDIVGREDHLIRMVLEDTPAMDVH